MPAWISSCSTLVLVLCLLSGLLSQSCLRAAEPRFVRGDSNADGFVNISDAIFTLRSLFLGGVEPRCEDASDADDSGGLDLADAVETLAFLFRGATILPDPGPLLCGTDPSADGLGCAGHPFCDAQSRPPVVLAIVDSGIDARHPDLAGRVLRGADLVRGDEEPEDELGHGTELAGIAAADGELVGECPECLILPIKVIDQEGFATQERVVLGIIEATSRGADVILVGCASVGALPELADAVQAAEDAGVVVVAPAGNFETAHTGYPAAFPTVVSAVASASDGTILATASASGYEDVAVLAENVIATNRGGGYVERSGSSVAAARAAGIVARIRAKAPGLSPAQVRQVLRGAVDPIALDRWQEHFDLGILSPAAALEAAREDLVDVAIQQVRVLPSSPLVGQPSSARVTVVNRGVLEAGPVVLRATWAGASVGDPVVLERLALGESVVVLLPLAGVASPGGARLEMALDALAGETRTENNLAMSTVPITQSPIHDVELTVGELSAPVAEVGEATFRITLRNKGNQDEPSVKLEILVEGELIGQDSLALDAGEVAVGEGRWTIGEDTSARLRALLVRASIPTEDADPVGNEWFLELSVGEEAAPQRAQYSDTRSSVDVVLDAPWMTIRDYVPVLVFLPQFVQGGSRTLDRVEIESYDRQRARGLGPVFIDYRELSKDGIPLRDLVLAGTTILGPSGQLRSTLAPNEPVASFWHYIVRLPLQSLDGGGASGEKYLRVSAEWSCKRFLWPCLGETHVKVLRVIVPEQPLPQFAPGDHYFDAHVHTIAEQTAWGGVLDSPRRNFGGPIAMLLESSYALGLVDQPYSGSNYGAYKDKLVVTDHNVFYSQEANVLRGSNGVLRRVTKPSRPLFGPTSGTSGASDEGAWYRTNLGLLAGEEVALASGPNQAGLDRNEGHHFLAYGTAHIEGPWHGGGFLGSDTANPNTLDAVLRTMKREGDQGFGYAAHPATAQVWSEEYLKLAVALPPENELAGPAVNGAGTEFIFKGLQVWNTKWDEVGAENGNLDSDDLTLIDPFTGPQEQRFRDHAAWVSEELTPTLVLYKRLVQDGLNFAFAEQPTRKFPRKLYMVGGSDAHGEFNYSDDVPLGSFIDEFLDYATLAGSAYARVRTYALVHDRATSGDATSTAVDAYREGNTVVTDGPIAVFRLDSDSRHNPGGTPRWHDAPDTWRFENREGRIGGAGDFDGGRTVLLPRRFEEDRTYPHVETSWLRSNLPGATNIAEHIVTRIFNSARRAGESDTTLPAGGSGQTVSGPYDDPILDMSALFMTSRAPHPTPRKDGRCITNPIWAAPVPIEVEHSGACPIAKGKLKVIFHFPLSIAAAGPAFIRPLDAAGNSAGPEVELKPDPGFEDEGDVFHGKYTAVNDEDIACPTGVWDAEVHTPPPAGQDVRSYVVYLTAPQEVHGSLLNDVGRTFVIRRGGTGTFLAQGDSFTVPPMIPSLIDVQGNDTFPPGSIFELVTGPGLHPDLFVWRGDGTFTIAPLTTSSMITLTYKITGPGGMSETATVTLTVNKSFLTSLRTIKDPETGMDYVVVPCLFLDGEHYPVHEFRLTNNPNDTCAEPHWHSSIPVFSLEDSTQPRTDPNLPSCGFGRFRDVPLKGYRMSLQQWQAFLEAHPGP